MTCKRVDRYNGRVLESVLLSYITEANSNRSQKIALSLWALTFKGVHENWLVLLPFWNSQPASLLVRRIIFTFIQHSCLEAPGELRALLQQTLSENMEPWALKGDRREWEGRQRHKEEICSESQNTSLRGQDLLVLHEVKGLKIPNTRWTLSPEKWYFLFKVHMAKSPSPVCKNTIYWVFSDTRHWSRIITALIHHGSADTPSSLQIEERFQD